MAKVNAYQEDILNKTKAAGTPAASDVKVGAGTNPNSAGYKAMQEAMAAAIDTTVPVYTNPTATATGGTNDAFISKLSALAAQEKAGAGVNPNSAGYKANEEAMAAAIDTTTPIYDTPSFNATEAVQQARAGQGSIGSDAPTAPEDLFSRQQELEGAYSTAAATAQQASEAARIAELRYLGLRADIEKARTTAEESYANYLRAPTEANEKTYIYYKEKLDQLTGSEDVSFTNYANRAQYADTVTKAADAAAREYQGYIYAENIRANNYARELEEYQQKNAEKLLKWQEENSADEIKTPAFLEKIQQERKTEVETQKKIEAYNQYTKAEDFDRNSQYEPKWNGQYKTITNPATGGIVVTGGSEDLIYDAINKNKSARDALLANDVAAGGLYGTYNAYLNYLDRTQISIFNYLYKTEGKEAAYQYLETIKPELEKSAQDAMVERVKAYADEHPFGSVASGTLMTVGLAPAKIPEYIRATLDTLSKTRSSSYDMGVTGYLDTVRQQNTESFGKWVGNLGKSAEGKEKWSNVGEFVYGTTASMLDFLYTSALAGTLGTAGAIGTKGVEAINLGIMGAEAAASATYEAMERGLSQEKAVALGTVAGFAEIITEKVSVENLFNASWDKSGKYIIKNIISEGSEEVGSDVINLFADFMIAQDKSQYRLKVNQLVNEGGLTEDEAFAQAFWDTMKEWGLDFLGGAISGGIMAGASTVLNKTANTENYKNLGDFLLRCGDNVIDSYIELGKVSSNAEIRTAAESIEAKRDAAKPITNTEIGKLAVEVWNEENAQNEQKPVGTPSNVQTTQPTTETRPTEGIQSASMTATTQTEELTLPGNEVQNTVAEEYADELERTAKEYGVDENVVNRVRRVTTALKTEAVFYSKDAENGYIENGYYDNDGVLHINAQSPNPETQIIGHELTHQLEGTTDYADFTDWVQEYLGADEYNRRIEEVTDRYEAAGYNADATHEVIAEFVERELLTNENAVYQLVSRNRTLAERILRWIRRAAAKLGKASAQKSEMLDRGIDLFQRMLDENGSQTRTSARQAELPRYVVEQTQQNTAPQPEGITLPGGEDAQRTNSTGSAQPQSVEWQGSDVEQENGAENTQNNEPVKASTKKSINAAPYLRKLLRQGIITQQDYDNAMKTGKLPLQAIADTLNKRAENVRQSKQMSVSEAVDKKITVGMTDSERGNILRNKTIPIVEYGGQADATIIENIRDLESQKKSLISAAINRIKESFDIPQTIKNSDYELVVTTTSRLFGESTFKQITDAKQLVKLIPVLEASVQGAVAIENHANKYYFDNDTVSFLNLLGGYVNGNNFVPIRFGVKQSKTGNNYLYVVIDNEAIKKAEVTAESHLDNKGRTPTDSADISVAKVLSKVNSPDILKYVPDEFLNDARKSEKYKAVAATIKKTNNKNDTKYAAYIRAGNLQAAGEMVKAAAKAAGYTYKAYHGTTNYGFTKFKPQAGKGFSWFTTSKEYSDAYTGNIARASRGNNFGDKRTGTYEVYLNPGKTLDIGEIREGVFERNSDGTIALSDRAREVFIDKLKLPESYIFDLGAEEDGTPNLSLPIWAITEGMEIADAIDGRYDSLHATEYGYETYGIPDGRRVKSADPVTYDDDGNVIPLSERFIESNPDIRYSISKADDAQNLSNLQKKLRSDFNIGAGSIRYINDQIRSYAETVSRMTANGENIDSENKAKEKLYKDLLDNFRVNNAPEDNTNAEIYANYLYGQRLYVPETVRKEFGDEWNSIRKKAFGLRIYLTNNVQDREANSLYSELTETFGNTFFPEEADERAQVEAMVNTADQSRNTVTTYEDYIDRMENEYGINRDETNNEYRKMFDEAIEDYLAPYREGARDLEPLGLPEERTQPGKKYLAAEAQKAQQFIDRITADDAVRADEEEAREWEALGNLEPEPKPGEGYVANHYTLADQQADIDEVAKFLYGLNQGLASKLTAEELAEISADRIRTTYSRPKEKGKNAKQIADETMRLFVDSGKSVNEIGKAIKDDYLYDYYDMARSSTNAVMSFIHDGRFGIDGREDGKSLLKIFDPIRAKGDEYYADFEKYLFHLHNVDRMSLYSEEREQSTRKAFSDYKKNNPELNSYTDDEILEIAQDFLNPLSFEAIEFEELYNAHNAAKIKNKPVFSDVIKAEDSMGAAQALERRHPEFADLAKEVYGYIDHLMDYRVASGLITEDERKRLKELYPHYVPTYRQFAEDKAERNKAAQRSKDSTIISTTVGRAVGSDEPLMPIHKALAAQTMSVIREGSKNRFGQRLLGLHGAQYQSIKNYIYDITEWDGGLNTSAFVESKDTKNETLDQAKSTNTFVVRQDGRAFELHVSPALYTAVKQLSPNISQFEKVENFLAGVNNVYKALVTSWKPTFLITNALKDFQDALFYSKDLKGFLRNFPRAYKEISKNGEYWRTYKALGGLYTSIFDFETGDMIEEGWMKRKVIDRITALNEAVEQAPRLAEFMATVKKAGGIEKADLDALMMAKHDAADVTVNFGRSGTAGKIVNRSFIPFFNPGIQGFDKMVRTLTGKDMANSKSFRAWATLAAKCTLFGFAPRMLNALLYRDDDEWQDIRDSDKNNYFLIKLKPGKWLKIPRGRLVAAFSIVANGGKNAVKAIKGEERFDIYNAFDFIVELANQTAPSNPLTTNIVASFAMARLFNKDSAGTTWYGGNIENQRLQNIATPGLRFDEKTDVVSVWLGKRLNLSPKKINYILDQYSGVIGDIALPLLAPAAKQIPGVTRFVLESTRDNELSDRFYRKLDELNMRTEAVDYTGADDVTLKYWSSVGKQISDINKQIRAINEDKSINNADKKEKLEAQYALRNEVIRNAFEHLPSYEYDARKNWTATGRIEDKEDRVDDAYRRTNRSEFGAAYALEKALSKDNFAKLAELNTNGVEWDDIYDAYYAIKNLDEDLKGIEEKRQKWDVVVGTSDDDTTIVEFTKKWMDSEPLNQGLQMALDSGMSAKEFMQAYRDIYLNDVGDLEDNAINGIELLKYVDDNELTDEQMMALVRAMPGSNTKKEPKLNESAEMYTTLKDNGLTPQNAYDVAMGLRSASSQEKKIAALGEMELDNKTIETAVGAVYGYKEATKSGTKTDYAHFLEAMDAGMSAGEALQMYNAGISASRISDYASYGVDVDTAKAVDEGLKSLPEELKDNSNAKINAVYDAISNKPLDVQLDAIAAALGEKGATRYEKTTIVALMGEDLDLWADFCATVDKYNEDGAGNLKNDEVRKAVDEFFANTLPGGNTQRTKAIFWQMTANTTSAKNNPYGSAVGNEALKYYNDYDADELRGMITLPK